MNANDTKVKPDTLNPDGCRVYTDAEVAQLMELAYESGWHQALDHIANGYAELHQTWRQRAAARLTYEERVAQRVAAMAPDDPDWLAKSAARLREHDRQCAAIAARFAPTSGHRVAA